MSENQEEVTPSTPSVATVVEAKAVLTSNPLKPQTAIVIAVDTAYVVNKGGGQSSQGVYMFDNRRHLGSTNEVGWSCRHAVTPGI